MIDSILTLFGIGVIVMPALLLAVIGLTSLLSRPIGEDAMADWTRTCVICGLLSSLAILGLMLLTGRRLVPLPCLRIRGHHSLW